MSEVLRQVIAIRAEKIEQVKKKIETAQLALSVMQAQQARDLAEWEAKEAQG